MKQTIIERLASRLKLAALVFVALNTVISPSIDAAELLVSDLITSRVLAYSYDPISGTMDGSFRVLVDGDSMANGGLSSPAAMAIGPGGDLFVASQGNGQVLRYDSSTGAFKGSFATGLPGPAGLLYDAAYDGGNGRLFVSTLGAADSTLIKIYNSAGSEIGEITGGEASGRTGMALDPVTGDLFVSGFNADGVDPGAGETGVVLRFHSADGFTNPTILIAGDGDYMNSPIIVAGMNGLAFDGNHIYAASMFGQQIIKMDPNELNPNDIVQGVLSSLDPPTAYPSGLSLAPNGDLLVTTLGNTNANDPIYGPMGMDLGLFPGTVQRFSANGDFLGELPIHGDATNELVGFLPTSILISPVPEPGGALIAIIGLGILAASRKRHR